MIEDLHWSCDGGVVMKFPNPAVELVGDPEIEPNRSRARQGDIAAGRDGVGNGGLVCGKIRELRLA